MAANLDNGEIEFGLRVLAQRKIKCNFFVLKYFVNSMRKNSSIKILEVLCFKRCSYIYKTLHCLAQGLYSSISAGIELTTASERQFCSTISDLRYLICLI